MREPGGASHMASCLGVMGRCIWKAQPVKQRAATAVRIALRSATILRLSHRPGFTFRVPGGSAFIVSGIRPSSLVEEFALPQQISDDGAPCADGVVGVGEFVAEVA